MKLKALDQRQAGILGPTILDNADTVHSIVNASFTMQHSAIGFGCIKIC